MVESKFTTGSDLDFPKLMLRKNGENVLFLRSSMGTVVYSPIVSRLGVWSQNWPMDEFEDLPKGSTVTITQK